VLGAVHACIGAALGALLRGKGRAFLAGVAAHAAADALPHSDFEAATEIPLAALAVVGIGTWKGVDSPEFWGAVGGLSPDFEHGLKLLKVITAEQEKFITHINDGEFHGRESGEKVSQILLAAAALAVLALVAGDCSEDRRTKQ